MYLLIKIIFRFPSKDSVLFIFFPFLGKRNTISLDNTRSHSSAMFLQRGSFQNIWKKKLWFFVQW